MRKFMIILLSACLLFSATACKNESAAPSTDPVQTQPTQTQSTETVETTIPPAIVDLPLLAFNAPLRSQDYFADDGTLLFTYAYQDFSLILEDPHVADAIVLDLLNQVDFENSAAKSVLTAAQAAYEGQDEWTAFTYSTYFTPERFDQSVMSLYSVHALQSGSPRSTTTMSSITYDLLSGRQLTLKDILTDDYSADALSQLITEALAPIAKQGLLFSDYAYVVSELFSTNRPVNSWYLSNEALCFYFAPYEIAPYSSGTIVAQIPYASLVDLLRDEFFPSEVTEGSGDPYMVPFQSVDLKQFDTFSEVVIDNSDVQFILYTNGYLQNLRIECGTYTDDGTFLSDATVFAAPALCVGDGIVLEATLDTIRNLRLTYESNGETIVTHAPFVYG